MLRVETVGEKARRGVIALLPLLALGCATAPEETSAHANFPQLLKAPSAIVKRAYRDGLYEDVERRLFRYDTQGRLLSERTLQRDADGVWHATAERTLTWGEGHQLLTWTEGDLRQDFTYASSDAAIPRIETVRLSRRVGSDWAPFGERRYDLSAEGGLVGVYTYALDDAGKPVLSHRVTIAPPDEQNRLRVSSLDRVDGQWLESSSVLYGYMTAEPNHLHGLTSIEDEDHLLRYSLDAEGNVVLGWEEFAKVDGRLQPRLRATTTHGEQHQTTFVEAFDAAAGRWTPSHQLETVYTTEGTSLFAEGPWQVGGAAETLISRDNHQFFPRCMSAYAI